MIQLELQRRLAGLLLPRERILWAGRPRQGFMFQPGDGFILPFMLFWTSGAVVLPMAKGAITWSLESLGFLPFVGGAFYMLIGRYLYDAWVRSRTYYAVTDKRIIVRREGKGGSLRALDRDGLPDMELKESGTRGSISFGVAPPTVRFGGNTREVYDGRLVFRSIPDARAVFDLIQRTKPRPAAPESSTFGVTDAEAGW